MSSSIFPDPSIPNAKKYPREKKSALWLVLTAIGLLSGVIGIITGATPVGNMCGSVFDQDSFAARIYDTLGGSPGGAASECASKIAAATTPTWIFIVLGVLLIVTGLIIRNTPRKTPIVIPTTGSEQSIAHKLEELVSLRDRGIITEGEFANKRKSLLDRM